MKVSTNPRDNVKSDSLNVVPSQHRAVHNRSRPYSLGDSYAGPDSFTLPQSFGSPAKPADARRPELPTTSPADVATVTRMHRVPAHTIAGCPFQLMAEVSASGADCTGVVRFFDQFKLLGAAAVDPETGIATLPYVFTTGGRRELSAVFDGAAGCSPSQSETESIQIYAGSGSSAADIIRIQL